jgi:hypothetical protein
VVADPLLLLPRTAEALTEAPSVVLKGAAIVVVLAATGNQYEIVSFPLSFPDVAFGKKLTFQSLKLFIATLLVYSSSDSPEFALG